MKKLLALLLIFILLLSSGCVDPGTETLTESADLNNTEDIESVTDTETEEEVIVLPPREPVVLSAEMQAKLGRYVPNSWLTKLEQLDIQDEETFVFAVQTDTHFSVKSGESTANNAKALSHFVPLDFIAHTGDLVKGYSDAEENTPENTTKSMSEIVRRYTEDVNCPVLLTFGNHDTNQIWCKENGTPADQLNKYDHYDLVISKLQEANGEAMVVEGQNTYYYMDFPYDGIRVIMLNTTDADYLTGFGSLSSISDKQVEWFRNVALNTKYSVLVMMHVPLIKYFPDNSSWSV
ncbi:MAG: metallophosphoesterase, partial [Clostridia bacterium]|nr:metallophosphoesterase [Clostridia bacterium]